MSDTTASWKEALSAEKSYRQLIQERDAQVGSLLEFDIARRPVPVGLNQDHPLAGLPYAVKDNICVSNFHCTCGSKMLEHFVSPYDATVISRLDQTGARVVAKTNLDEFGMGSSTDNSAFKQTNNPFDVSRVAGGSSGGSAAAVAAGLVPFALGSDTGGSVRQPAMFCGVYGLKPTYGAVSRYGLVAYASSLEGVGIVGADVSIVEKVFETIRGIDPNDHTSVEYPIPPLGPTVKTIGVLKVDGGMSPAMNKAWAEFCLALQKAGYKTKEISLPTMEYAVPAYYTIASAEASSNLARYNGVRYGYRPVFSENPEDLVRKSRSDAFGPEVKLRILLGTYVLRSGFQDQYYHKAQAVRSLIRKQANALFNDVDLVAMPVYPSQAFHHGNADLDAFQQKMADKFTTVANLTGLPALAVPGPQIDGLPTGFQFMAPAFAEHRCFEVAKSLSKVFPALVPEKFPVRYSLKGGL